MTELIFTIEIDIDTVDGGDVPADAQFDVRDALKAVLGNAIEHHTLDNKGLVVTIGDVKIPL